ncbi:TIGR00730 family Rossman fold protein [Streptomyces tremellae]|uniref:Cytokinin riboside 5'-monophosphate phosphoribohydrolase n=1 Tax=Streptomyces tremellae TaxID=1124239 RepID=A0ABP7G385_9ACTN
MSGRVASAAVFCGRTPGNDPRYESSAAALGKGLAAAGVELVFGGGAHGMMAAVADAALAAGGEVSGFIPEFLVQREGVHPGVRRIVLTGTLHERKRAMYEAADAFVVLPGGLGTLDETVEVITWRQVDLHDKPVVVVNVGGWADPLIGALDAALSQGFAGAGTQDLFTVVPDAAAALDRVTAS